MTLLSLWPEQQSAPKLDIKRELRRLRNQVEGQIQDKKEEISNTIDLIRETLEKTEGISDVDHASRIVEVLQKRIDSNYESILSSQILINDILKALEIRQEDDLLAKYKEILQKMENNALQTNLVYVNTQMKEMAPMRELRPPQTPIEGTSIQNAKRLLDSVPAVPRYTGVQFNLNDSRDDYLSLY